MNDRLTLLDLFLSSCRMWKVSVLHCGEEGDGCISLNPRVQECKMCESYHITDDSHNVYDIYAIDFGDGLLTLTSDKFVQTWRMVR